MKTDASLVSTHTHRLSLHLRRPPAAVWRAFSEDVGIWWPESFYATPAPRKLVFEARLGGRLYEDRGAGNGLIWYEVIELDAPRTVLLRGSAAPPFGGPLTTLLRLSFTPAGEGGTQFELTDSLFGCLGDQSSTAAGWQELFGEAFRRFVERLPE